MLSVLCEGERGVNDRMGWIVLIMGVSLVVLSGSGMLYSGRWDVL